MTTATIAMTKFDEYTANAGVSLAAAQAATNERDRAFHYRAHGVWRRLIVGIAQAEERAVMNAQSAKAKPPTPKRF